MLYNGPRPWRSPTAIEDLAQAPEGWEFAPRPLSGEFLLLDLSQVPDATLEARAVNPHLTLGLMVLKHVRSPNPWGRFLEWSQRLDVVRRMPGGDDRILDVLHYLFRAAVTPSAEERQRVIDLLPEFERDIVTWEQQILSEGERRGRLETLRHTVRVLLTARFGPLPTEAERHIDEADETVLKGLIERFPAFEGSLDEFLAS